MKRIALCGAICLAAAALWGCNSPSSSTSSSSSSSSAEKPAAPAQKAAAPAEGKELNLFAWSEYVPQSVIDGFTKETGIKVNYETYASNEEMLSKLLSGATKYDL